LYSAGHGPELDSLTAADLQAEHLAHHDDQGKRGLIVVVGPYGKNDAGWWGPPFYDRDNRKK